MSRSDLCPVWVVLLLLSACRDPQAANQRIADSIVSSLGDSVIDARAVGGWRAADSVPHRRLEGATATIGQRAYLIGGFGGPELDGILDVDVFDHGTGQWTQAAALPEAVTHMQAAVVGDTAIWIAGGFVGRHPAPPTDAVWRYDVATNRWIPGPTLPAARGGGALLALGDTLYFVGGWAEDRVIERREVWRLLPRAATWQARAPIPEGRGHVSAVGTAGKLFLLGGQQSHDLSPVDLQTAWSYHPAADRWTQLADAPTTRSHAEPAVVRWGDWILVPGGGDIGTGRRYIADMLGYDMRRDRWRRLQDLPTKLRGAHAWLDGDTLQITGGAEVNNAPSNWIRWQRALRGEWMLLPGDGPRVNPAFVAVVGDNLLLFGSDQRPTYRYDLRSGEWGRDGDLPFRPRQGEIQAVASEGHVLQLLGGASVSGTGPLLQAFDGVRSRWTPGVAIPSGVTTPALVIARGVTWLVRAARGQADSGAVFRLGGDGQWDSVATLPVPRFRPAIATDGEQLCLFGGAVPGERRWSNDAQCLDLAKLSWRTSAAGQLAPIPVWGGNRPDGAVFVGGRFWVYGAPQPQGYDPVRNSWAVGATAPFSGMSVADGDRVLRYVPETGRVWMLWP